MKIKMMIIIVIIKLKNHKNQRIALMEKIKNKSMSIGHIKGAMLITLTENKGVNL